ncbi:MAG: hypothetical protein MJ060_04600 [Clostridia bacterium]|nr:hypothetical protein [Clostridia bacterium]
MLNSIFQYILPIEGAYSLSECSTFSKMGAGMPEHPYPRVLDFYYPWVLDFYYPSGAGFLLSLGCWIFTIPRVLDFYYPLGAGFLIGGGVLIFDTPGVLGIPIWVGSACVCLVGYRV